MELSPTDARLKLIGNIDLFKTDEKYNFTLTGILRERQRPLLILIDRDGNLLYSSATPLEGTPRPGETAVTQGLLDGALIEVQRLFRQQPQPIASVVEQLTINKPGERCALAILGNELYGLRLYGSRLSQIYASQTGRQDANRRRFDRARVADEDLNGS